MECDLRRYMGRNDLKGNGKIRFSFFWWVYLWFKDISYGVIKVEVYSMILFVVFEFI